MEQADGSFIERARVHRDERKTGATNEFVATGDLSGEVTWYVEGNKVMVPKFGSTGKIQADGNITWDREGTKAVYEGNSGEPILNSDSGMLQGEISLKSVHGKFLSAQPDGSAQWNRDVASTWEYFHIEERPGGKITLKSSHGKYVSAQADGSVQINRDAAPPGGWEEFTGELRDNGVFCLKSCHGKYLSAQQDGTAQWNRDHAPRGGWEEFQIEHSGDTGQRESAAMAASMPPIVTVSGAGSSEVNGTYVFKPGEHENRHWGTIAGHYQHTQNPEIFIAFQDCGTAHQRPEWNKWMIISKIGVLYAAHTGGKIGVPPRDGEWETVDSWGNPGAPGGKHPAPTVRHGEQASKAATKIQQLVARRGEGPIEILEAVTGKPVRFKLNDPPNHNDAWVGIYPTGASDQDHGAQNQRWKYIRDIDVNNALLTQQPAGDWSLRVFNDGGYTVHERKDFTIHSNLGTPASESIEILEAVTKKPVRFKINNPPTNHDAWVGIYPPNWGDQDHGAQNQRWKWLRDIDVNDASFPMQMEEDWSIRVFSDGGYTLHERKDFAVKQNPDISDEVDAESNKRPAIVAIVTGIIMFSIGLPLFIVGNITDGEDNLAMIIPGAIMFGVGAFVAIVPGIAISPLGSYLSKWETKARIARHRAEPLDPAAVKSTKKKAWTALAIGLLLLAPGIPLFILGLGGGFEYEAVSSGTFEIEDADGQGDWGFEIYIEGAPGDFDGNGLHDYCEYFSEEVNLSAVWTAENTPGESRQVFYLEITSDADGGEGCDSHHHAKEVHHYGTQLVKIGRACSGCHQGTTTITAQNQQGDEVLMWIKTEENQVKLGMLIPGAIMMGIGALTVIGSLGILAKTRHSHGRSQATSAASSYSIQLEDMSFWDDITEGSEDNRSYHDKLLEKMKYPDKEEIEQDIQSGKPLQKWYSHWLHDPAKSAELAKALGLVVGGAGYDFEGPWSTKGLYAYRSGKYSGHAYFGTGGSDEDRLAPEDDDDKYRPWDRNDPKTPENIRKIWLEIEPRLARSYYLDPPDDD